MTSSHNIEAGAFGAGILEIWSLFPDPGFGVGAGILFRSWSRPKFSWLRVDDQHCGRHTATHVFGCCLTWSDLATWGYIFTICATDVWKDILKFAVAAPFFTIKKTPWGNHSPAMRVLNVQKNCGTQIPASLFLTVTVYLHLKSPWVTLSGCYTRTKRVFACFYHVWC